MTTPLLEIRELTFRYPGQPPILEDLSFPLNIGEMLALIGPNGSGKSTLLKLLTGALEPDSGVIAFRGKHRMALVPQFLPPPSRYTVGEIVLMGRSAMRPRFSFVGRRDRQAVESALELAGIPSMRDRIYGELSGGERQKAIIAAALAGEPELLLLDEPTAALDIAGISNLMHLLRKLKREGITLILVSHDLPFAAALADYVLLMKKDSVPLFGTPEDLTEETLQALFSCNLKLTRDPDGTLHITPL